MPDQTKTDGRRLVVLALVIAAVCGALIRAFAPNPSLLRDIGSVLLVLWLPVIGNVIAFFVRKIPKPAPPPLAFEPGRPFAPHLVVEFTPLVADVAALPEPEDPEQHSFTLAVGRDGFRARAVDEPVTYLSTKGPMQLELEMLRPAGALPKLPAGAEFRMLWGRNGVGKGRVLQHLTRPSP